MSIIQNVFLPVSRMNSLVFVKVRCALARWTFVGVWCNRWMLECNKAIKMWLWNLFLIGAGFFCGFSHFNSKSFEQQSKRKQKTDNIFFFISPGFFWFLVNVSANYLAPLYYGMIDASEKPPSTNFVFIRFAFWLTKCQKFNSFSHDYA